MWRLTWRLRQVSKPLYDSVNMSDHHNLELMFILFVSNRRPGASYEETLRVGLENVELRKQKASSIMGFGTCRSLRRSVRRTSDDIDIRRR